MDYERKQRFQFKGSAHGQSWQGIMIEHVPLHNAQPVIEGTRLQQVLASDFSQLQDA
jgi:hypothetical protein